jgi:ribonuclease T2
MKKKIIILSILIIISLFSGYIIYEKISQNTLGTIKQIPKTEDEIKQTPKTDTDEFQLSFTFTFTSKNLPYSNLKINKEYEVTQVTNTKKEEPRVLISIKNKTTNETTKDKNNLWVNANEGILKINGHIVAPNNLYKLIDTTTQKEIIKKNILAILWLPEVCQQEYMKQKLVCQNLSNDSFSAKNFVLHGFWIIKEKPKLPVFCGTISKDEIKKYTFEKLPKVNISDKTYNSLKKMMPEVLNGLEKYEWQKHGTCSGYDPEQFFSIQIDLLEQVNKAKFKNYITENIEQEVSISKIKELFNQEFGENSAQTLLFNCNKTDTNKLIQIKIILNSELEIPISLNDSLYRNLENNVISNCESDKILIEAVN